MSPPTPSHASTWPASRATSKQTFALAHTARCKLQLAADRPDRDLRFILGHAFTLDKLLLRVVEIERDGSLSDSESDDGTRPTCTAGGEKKERSVNFRHGETPRAGSSTRQRSPPPTTVAERELSDSESSSSDDDIEDDDEDNEGLGLQRFGSATATPPRMIPDEGEEEEVDEPKSPTQDELMEIVKGECSEELEGLYNDVTRCPCHGQGGHVQVAEKAWEVPQKEGWEGNRMAVVQVAA